MSRQIFISIDSLVKQTRTERGSIDASAFTTAAELHLFEPVGGQTIYIIEVRIIRVCLRIIKFDGIFVEIKFH